MYKITEHLFIKIINSYVGTDKVYSYGKNS